MAESIIDKVADYQQALKRLDELAENVERDVKLVYRLLEGCEIPSVKFDATAKFSAQATKSKEGYLKINGRGGRNNFFFFNIDIGPKRKTVKSFLSTKTEYDFDNLEVLVLTNTDDERYKTLKEAFNDIGAKITQGQSAEPYSDMLTAIIKSPAAFLDSLSRLSTVTKSLVYEYSCTKSKLSGFIDFNAFYKNDTERFKKVFPEISEEEKVNVIKGIMKLGQKNELVDIWLIEKYKEIVDAAGRAIVVEGANEQ